MTDLALSSSWVGSDSSFLVEAANFLDMKSGGVLPKPIDGTDLGLAKKLLTDCFILTTVSGLARSFARLLIRCSSRVSLVIELSMIFCRVLAVFSRAGAFLY